MIKKIELRLKKEQFDLQTLDPLTSCRSTESNLADPL